MLGEMSEQTNVKNRYRGGLQRLSGGDRVDIVYRAVNQGPVQCIHV